MKKKTIKIQLSTGIDARPVAMMVQVASEYESQIHIEYGERCVNAKSIMGMMSLGLPEGEEVVVSANGKDEAEALEGIERFLATGEGAQ